MSKNNLIDSAMESIRDKKDKEEKKDDQKGKKIVEKENKGNYCKECGSKLVKGDCPKC